MAVEKTEQIHSNHNWLQTPTCFAVSFVKMLHKEHKKHAIGIEKPKNKEGYQWYKRKIDPWLTIVFL